MCAVCGVGVWEECECVGVWEGGAIHCSQQVLMFSIHVLSSHTSYSTVICLVMLSLLYVNMTYRSLIVSM